MLLSLSAPPILSITETLSDFTETDITNALDSLSANHGAIFSFGSGTFLAINDGISGFDVTSDALIEITGYEGKLDELKIV